MGSTVYMPKLGLTMKKGTIVVWKLKEGDSVQKGDKIATMDTEKVTVDIEAPASGILLKILAPVKASVSVGQPIAYIGEAGEAIPEAAVPVAPILQSVGGAQASPASSAGLPMRQGARATPKAKRLAAEKRVELVQVKGTGPAGMISEEDVLSYIQLKRSASRSGLKVKDFRELSSVRSVIAERMTSSLRETAQLTLTYETDASELVKARDTLRARIEGKTGTRLTYTDILVKVVARALLEHPVINSVLEDDAIKILEEVNVGVAVATDNGLAVPVVRAADKMDLAQVSSMAAGLIEKARRGALSFEEVTGGTFTITNLGMTAVDTFTPIINPPQTAILGVGRIVNKPTAVDMKVEVRPTVTFSLTFDHRVVDGYAAGEFLGRIAHIIETASELSETLQ